MEETNPPGNGTAAREMWKPRGFPNDEAVGHETVRGLPGWKQGSDRGLPDSGLATGCGLRLHARPEGETHSAGLRPALGETRKKQPAEERLPGGGRRESGSPAKDTVPADTKK